ncbi:hypothetical protein ACFPM0_36680 [Pseudonocardia sulfidoxydans]
MASVVRSIHRNRVREPGDRGPAADSELLQNRELCGPQPGCGEDPVVT